MGRLVFIDFDGTLADRGVIPPAHIEAVHAAQHRGHRIMLCTGRPRALVSDQNRAIFDGLVGAAGGYVELDGQVLSDRRFSPELGARVVGLLDAHNVAYILEAPEGVYARAGSPERISALLQVELGEAETGRTGHDITSTVQVVDDPGSIAFSKVTCFDSNIPIAQLAAQLSPEVGLVPSSMAALGDRAGELYLADVNKSVGMAVVAEHYGVDRSQLIAIGDGFNDLEMLQYADTAVAIAGSPESVLALADFVVPPPAEAGLVEGFARLGLTA
ncbi:MAG: HAD hydrolase family protein [Micropruina sp.]|uniref:HAD hydrolase family protein n=1 Tax=Micropruina sp. TaxID=2737536 RepID=UPI0039E35CE9